MNLILVILSVFSVIAPVMLCFLIHREESLRNAKKEKPFILGKNVGGNANVQRIKRTKGVKEEMSLSDASRTVVPKFIVFSQDRPSVIGGEYVIVIGGHPCACLEEGLTVFGRGEETDVPIRDASVSRIHFSILVEDEQAYITDLGSTNGTYIDGVRVSKDQEIYDGDVIRAGGVNLSFAFV